MRSGKVWSKILLGFFMALLFAGAAFFTSACSGGGGGMGMGN